jgi:hypothetical protein
MGALASTDVSLSIATVDRHILGSVKMVQGTATFGGAALTYPFGGVPIPDKGKFGFVKEILEMEFYDPTSGVMWRYDKTNNTLKAFTRAPVIIFEEVVTMTDGATYDTGTTKYPMAWPLYASNGNQALGIMPKGMNPVTTTISINMHADAPGTRATITSLQATDNYATITISYITQAWREVLDNLVEGETMTAGATTTNGITFTAATPDVISFLSVGSGFLCGLMIGTKLSSIYACPKPLYKGETAAAAEYALDWTNTSPAATTVKPLQTQVWDAAGNVVYFNYLKQPTSGFLYDRFIEEDSSSASGQIYTLAASAANIIVPMLFCTPGFVPGPTVSSTIGTWPIGGTGMTLGTTAQWQPTNYHPKQKLVTAGTFTSGTGVSATNACKMSYIWGIPEDIPGVVPLEMPNGQVVLSKTLRFTAWGK